MEITLSEKRFTLRADMRAIKAAKFVGGVDIATMGEDVISVGTLTYYMARSGAIHTGQKFGYELDDFLALITVSELEEIAEAVASLFAPEKKAKAKKGGKKATAKG